MGYTGRVTIVRLFNPSATLRSPVRQSAQTIASVVTLPLVQPAGQYECGLASMGRLRALWAHHFLEMPVPAMNLGDWIATKLCVTTWLVPKNSGFLRASILLLLNPLVPNF